MKIGEVAKFAKVGVSNLRFYQKHELIPIVESNDYSDEIAIKAKKIAILRSIGLSFSEVKDIVLKKCTLIDVVNLKKHDVDKDGISGKYFSFILENKLSFESFDVTKSAYAIGVEVVPAPNFDDSLANCPHSFERGMATTLDTLFVILFTVFAFVYLLRFKVWYSEVLLIFLISVIVLFGVPSVLALFGTTLGNLTVGLKIRHFTGRKLTLKGSILRKTVASGWSKELENLDKKQQYYSWSGNKKTIRMGGVLPWDCNCQITLAPSKKWRQVLTVILAVVLVLSSIGFMCLSNMPKNFGDVTVAEFSENYNTMIKARAYQFDEQFNNFPLTVYLDENGNFVDNIEPVDASYFHFPMEIETENGVVTKVEITSEITNTTTSGESEDNILVMREKQEELIFDALVSPSNGVFSFFKYSSDDNIEKIGKFVENYSFTVGNWKITNTVEMVNITEDNYISNNNLFLVIPSGGTYNHTFTIEKIK